MAQRGQEHGKRISAPSGIVLMMIASLGLLTTSCSKVRTDRTNCCPCPGASSAPVVDTSLMAYLSMAKAAHHKADICERNEDTRCAIAALEQVASNPLGKSVNAPIEAKEVLADTLARLADLVSKSGDYERASKYTRRGLSLVEKGSYFEGNLLVARGINEQRWAASLQRTGNLQEAKQLRTQAAQDLARAVDIQDDVIRRALSADAGPDAPTQAGRKE